MPLLLPSSANLTGQSAPIGRASAKGKQVSAKDNLYFDSPVLSRNHGKIFLTNGAVYLEDTDSTHGTRYRAQNVSGFTKLAKGAAQLLSDKCIVHFGLDLKKEKRESCSE